VRAADLRSFRSALVALATDGSPLDARDRLVIVPTRAASLHLVRTIEDRMSARGAVILPDFITRAELHQRLFERIGGPEDLAARTAPPCTAAPYTSAEREALLAVACREAIDAGADPPFRVRPGLVAAMLEFFDSLKRHQKSVDDFERLTMGRLDSGAAGDRGAERLIRQTRFFAAAFREFERRCAASGGVDEHAMRAQLLVSQPAHPWRHVIVAVRDRAGDRYGLHPVDWDLLARIAGLERLDVVVTDTTLAGAFHERIHQWLPGIEEVRWEPATGSGQRAAAHLHVARDREEEVAGFARWVRAEAGETGSPALDRMAIVVRQRLPYVYLAREVFRSAGVPCQMFDALPLAAEPYAAALDLVFSFVSADFARVPAIALLRSPYFRIAAGDDQPIREGEIAALDRALSEAGYLGGLDALDRLVESWQREGLRVSRTAVRGASILRAAALEIEPLRSDATIAEHVDRVLCFLTAHENLPGPDDPLRARQLRARGAILGLLRALGDAHRRFDSRVVAFDEVAAMVRRGIETQTFAPRSGESGVHLVDADSAPFGEFDLVQLAGLVDGEWPDRPRRNIFYSAAILRELGWPADADRLEGIRASFTDLLRLPLRELAISTFSLEHDSIVAPSILIDEMAGAGSEGSGAGLKTRPYTLPQADDGLVLSDAARVWAMRRLERPADSIAGGQTSGHAAKAYSVSALERYQDCPFKFFASDVLQLDEPPEDEGALSPRARGRFIHEVFQRFFEEWDRRGGGTITSDRLDDARAVFAETAEPLLANLAEADSALERTRLFGSAISVGIVDVVLGLEASRPVDVVERWLEYRLEGEFSLGAAGGRPVPLRGVADRIDLLAGNRLRVIDYKSGYAPQPKRALQVPMYALCAQERLGEQRGGTWQVDEAAYVAFSGKRSLVPVIKAGKDAQDSVLADARTRLLDIVGSIERGEFPPRPYEPRICSYCAYPSVCRKDYVGDE
jgi:RecB family exonuclease